MKTILCPTDFTTASEGAVRYSYELSKKFDTKIILFHTYFVPPPPPDVPYMSPDPFDLQKEAKQALTDLKNKMKGEYPKVKSEVELITREGNPVDEVENLQKEYKVNLIITGTKGASGLRKIFGGSNSAKISAAVDCPVIIVPEGSEFRDLRTIVFATNYAEGDFGNIEEVIALARPFDAHVILLHISEGKLDKTGEYASIEHFKQRIEEETGYHNLEFKLLESRNIEDGILNFMEGVRADMIAMTNRHRTFFQRIFDQSLTMQVAFDTHTPLIAFHEAKQEAFFN